MTITEIALVLLAVGYALYRQTQVHEQTGQARFKLAIIYGIVGLAVGGISRPNTLAEGGLFAGSIALSVVIGLLRGRCTAVWADADGRVYSRGTALTIGLFLGLIVAKFALGTVAYLTNVSDDGGFGEVLLMMAVMVALQAELVWRRALALKTGATAGAASPAPADRPRVAG